MNRFCTDFKLQYPIIQAGMIWCSCWDLASACSNEGILGVIGSGSMYPDILEEHILKCKAATDKPFAVNIPLIYPQVDDHIELIEKHKVPIVISSAGDPKKWTERLQDSGIKVMHVVSSRKFAMKAQAAGVDAVIAEGFEAGGHNGREETTTLCLIPDVRKAIDIPLIAAGGVASGSAMLAAMALGADGVQIGSRFVASVESSAHKAFKNAVVAAKEGDTKLMLKELTPVRLLNGPFAQAVQKAYDDDADVETLRALLGRGRAKKGMYLGDLEEGELEIGQISSMIDGVQPAKAIIWEILSEFEEKRQELQSKDRYLFAH